MFCSQRKKWKGPRVDASRKEGFLGLKDTMYMLPCQCDGNNDRYVQIWPICMMRNFYTGPTWFTRNVAKSALQGPLHRHHVAAQSGSFKTQATSRAACAKCWGEEGRLWWDSLGTGERSNLSGWWFGTLFIYPFIENNSPNWLTYFSEEWGQPPTRFIFTFW